MSETAEAVASTIAASEGVTATPQSETPSVSPEVEGVTTSSDVQNTPVELEKPVDTDPDFVRRFNALSRREQETIKRERELKEKYSEYENYQRERAKLKENPLEFLEANGWNFKDLADFVLNDQKPTAENQVSKLQRKIEEIENERKREIEERERREKESYNNQVITTFKNNIKQEVASNVDQYELINHYGEFDTVYEVIENYYNQHGVVLDIKKAALEVEKHLEQQVERAASTNKFRKKYSPIEQAISESAEQKTMSSEPKTLTNDLVSTGTSSQSSVESQTYLSDEESKRRSAEILREFLLKKKGYTKNP